MPSPWGFTFYKESTELYCKEKESITCKEKNKEIGERGGVGRKKRISPPPGPITKWKMIEGLTSCHFTPQNDKKIDPNKFNFSLNLS
jgi:hypothetical protein